MLVTTAISLAIGVLPYIDNFSHVGGFMTGILTGLIFMPTIHFGKWDRRRKRFLMLVAFPGVIILFVIGLRSFYLSSISCDWCKYVDCITIPGLADFCDMP